MEFEGGLRKLLNTTSQENGSDTPDYLLATYLMRCLDAYNETVIARRHWWQGKQPKTKMGKDDTLWERS